MGRVSNETNLVIALLKEKAKAKKREIESNELDEQKRFFWKRGIDWTLDTLNEILKQEIIDR